MDWFTKSAQQGDARSQHQLGFMYAMGIDVPQDEDKAFEWTKKAASQGFLDAEKNLGAMYLKGVGVEPNVDKAIFWLRKAARRNNSEAIEYLKYIMDTAVKVE